MIGLKSRAQLFKRKQISLKTDVILTRKGIIDLSKNSFFHFKIPRSLVAARFFYAIHLTIQNSKNLFQDFSRKRFLGY